MNLYLGRWEWHTADSFPYWRAPGGNQVGALDLRSIPQMSRRGGMPEGFGLFAYDTPQSHPLLRRSLGVGFDAPLDATGQTFLRNRLGLPAGDISSPRKFIRAAVLNGDSTGALRMKPLTGNRRSGVELRFTSQDVIRERWSETHPVFASTVAVFRADYTRERKARVPLLILRRMTGSKMQDLWGEMTDARAVELLPTAYNTDGWRRPRTTITENWNCADDTTGISCNLTWLVTAGNIDLLSNKASFRSIDASMDARAESDLSSDDHYAQLDVVTLVQPATGDTSCGPCARFSASARTWYLAYLTNQASGSDKIIFYKVVAGIFTALDTDQNITLSIPDTMKCEVNGSTMKSYFNGVVKHNFTDTAITGNLRTGMFGWIRSGESAGDAEVDNFSAADLAAAAGRIMSSLAHHGGLAGYGGIAGKGGGLAA